MKRILIFTLVLLVSTSIFAAEGEKAFNKDKKVIDLSVGFSSLTTPFAVGYEHPISDNLGLNISALILSWGYDLGYLGDLNQTLIMPQASVNYHFKMKSSRWDVYAGAGVGFSIYNSDWTNETAAGGFFLNGVIGVRYYISRKIAIQARETLVAIGDWGGSYTLIGVSIVL